jgi:trimethylamine--corrinoid protein Co-methyltransferase
MTQPFRLKILSDQELRETHETSVRILSEVGVKLHHDGVFEVLVGQGGIHIDKNKRLAKFSEARIMESIAKAGKQVKVYGRDPSKVIPYGYGYVSFLSSPGEYAWVESDRRIRRQPTLQDLQDAIRVGDALDQIDGVGAMAQPVEIPVAVRDVRIHAEMLKGTTKPVFGWIHNRRSLKWILELLKTVAGGEKELRQKPMIAYGIEPISPLQFCYDSLDITMELAALDQPLFFGPIAQCMATAPGTLIGTVAQENAEILAGVAITQVLRPGLPILYAGAPMIMDPQTTTPSLGSPEQALMAAAMAQLGRSYGFSVFANIGFSDSKRIDFQSGFERAFTLLFGALAGVEGCGSYGIVGTDQGASLLQLVADNEMIAYFRRLLRGFEVNQDKLALEVVRKVGPGGNFLAEEHTRRHFRQEIWIPRLCDRQNWEAWESSGSKDMMERAKEELERILKEHQPEPLDESLGREIESIAEAAEADLLSQNDARL